MPCFVASDKVVARNTCLSCSSPVLQSPIDQVDSESSSTRHGTKVPRRPPSKPAPEPTPISHSFGPYWFKPPSWLSVSLHRRTGSVSGAGSGSAFAPPIPIMHPPIRCLQGKKWAPEATRSRSDDFVGLSLALQFLLQRL